MRKLALGLGCAALLGTASSSWAVVGVVVSEDFESYADSTALLAAWSDTGGFDATLEGDATIDTPGFGTTDTSGNNFAYHPGLGGFALGVAAMDLPSAISATADEWIQLTVDMYDNDFGGGEDNKRMSLGLRSNSAAQNLIELGFYNSPYGAHHSYRAVLFDSINGTPNPSWAYWDMGTREVDRNGDGVITPDNGDDIIDPGEEPLDTGPGGVPDGTLQLWENEDDAPVNQFSGAKWYTYRVTIKPEELVFEIDVDYDGVFDFEATHIDIPATAAGFDQLRFGGPSGISSSGGGVIFDNILLEIIEAPSDLPGDLNGDGFVGIADLNIILGEWNANPPTNPQADPTGDNFVGIEDLNIVLGNWNAGTPPTAAAVPEPTTLALLGLGGLAMLKRRR